MKLIAREAVEADLEQQKIALETLQNTVNELSIKLGGLSTKYDTLSQSLTELAECHQRCRERS